MKILGFSFRKISIEKHSDSFKELKINTNLDVLELKKVDTDFLKEKEEAFNVKFKYVLDYEPKIAKIEFEGGILISVELEKAKEIIEKWKDKKIVDEIKIPLFNLIMRKSNIRALQLQDEMNLPSHIRLPSLKKSDEEKTENSDTKPNQNIPSKKE